MAPSTSDVADGEGNRKEDAISPDHYSRYAIEPIKYILENGLGYCVGNIIKYVTRYPHKGRSLEDLKKARRYLDWLIREEEEKEANFFGANGKTTSKAEPLSSHELLADTRMP